MTTRSRWVGSCVIYMATANQSQQYDSRVVADNFKFGADRNIIVALEQDVLMANKRDLSKVSPSNSQASLRLIYQADTCLARSEFIFAYTDKQNSPFSQRDCA